MEISIIGGGITGLTTALALHQNGLQPKVYERAKNLNEIGAGLWLQPNAMQVMKWLNLERDLKNEGHLLNKMEISYPDLTPVKKIKHNTVADLHGNQTIAIHRSKLQSILYTKCQQLELISLDSQYIGHEEVENKIHLKFSNETVETDVLLGADGINSNVRSSMGLPSQFRYSGQICCRGIANLTLPEYLLNEGKELWGHKLRFGFSQLSENTVYFFVVMNKEISPKEITKDSLIALFKDFNPVVTDIIGAAGDMHISELMDLKRLTTWHHANTCLLGDAAHATTPNMGQGACQGIEDAYYISKMLKETESPPEAFSAFEQQRRQKVDYVVNNSWSFGKMSHNTVGQSLLKGMMKLTPESIIKNQMLKLYRIDGL